MPKLSEPLKLRIVNALQEQLDENGNSLFFATPLPNERFGVDGTHNTFTFNSQAMPLPSFKK